MKNLCSILGQSNWIVLNRDLVLSIGLDAAYYYSHLLDLHKYYSNREQLKDGWFFATHSDIQNRIGLGRRTQETCEKLLIKVGLIQTKLKGMPATKHYKFPQNSDEILLSICTQTPNKFGAKVQTSLDKNAKLDCTQTPNKFAPNVQQTITDKQEQKEITDNIYTDFLQKSDTPTSSFSDFPKNQVQEEKEKKVAAKKEKPQPQPPALTVNSEILTASDIDATPVPENTNPAFFAVLRDFAKVAIKKAKSKRLELAGWSLMVEKFGIASKSVSPEILVDCLKNGVANAKKWNTPFYTDWWSVNIVQPKEKTKTIQTENFSDLRLKVESLGYRIQPNSLERLCAQISAILPKEMAAKAQEKTLTLLKSSEAKKYSDINSIVTNFDTILTQLKNDKSKAAKTA